MASTTVQYRVTSITENGEDSVAVNFVEVRDGETGTYGTFSRTFSTEEGKSYFPGQTYKMTLTAS